MTLTPNSIDGILFFVIFVFAILAFLKGFVKEFFSTLNLIIAIVTSYISAPFVAKLFDNVEAPQILIDLGVQFIVFVIILIICSIISSKISSPLSEKIPHFLNQSLGFGFGFLKGYLIISFIFTILLFFYSNQPFSTDPETKIADSKKKEKFGPEWFRDSKSYDLLDYGASFLKPLVDDILSQIKVGGSNDSKESEDSGGQLDTINKIIKTQKLYDQMLKDEDNPILPETNEPQTPETDQDNQQNKETGYTDQEIKKMKRLIEIMSN